MFFRMFLPKAGQKVLRRVQVSTVLRPCQGVPGRARVRSREKPLSILPAFMGAKWGPNSRERPRKTGKFRERAGKGFTRLSRRGSRLSTRISYTRGRGGSFFESVRFNRSRTLPCNVFQHFLMLQDRPKHAWGPKGGHFPCAPSHYAAILPFSSRGNPHRRRRVDGRLALWQIAAGRRI